MENINIGVIATIIFALMVTTNIIVEVVKKATWDKLPTNVVVVIVAEALTLASGAAYAEINGIPIMWYMVAGAAVVGLFVAYAAMFGFDKLQQAFQQRQANKETE